MAREQLMQFDVEGEWLRRAATPALDHPRVRHRIEGRIDLHHLELLRVPRQAIPRGHAFRVPSLDESRIRPAGCPHQDARLRCHPPTETRRRSRAKVAMIARL